MFEEHGGETSILCPHPKSKTFDKDDTPGEFKLTFLQDESNTTVQVKPEPDDNVLIFLKDLVGKTVLMSFEPDG